MVKMQKITTNLWFDDQAEDASKFYTSIFKNSSIGRIVRYGKAGYEFHGKPEGTAMTVEFQIDGSSFVALNGGPVFKFTEAISFIVNCENQDEIDYFWEKLTEGGDPDAQRCGWLKDKFGVSWQVVPAEMIDMIASSDFEKSQKVMTALLPMKKIDLAALKKAFMA